MRRFCGAPHVSLIGIRNVLMENILALMVLRAFHVTLEMNATTIWSMLATQATTNKTVVKRHALHVLQTLHLVEKGLQVLWSVIVVTPINTGRGLDVRLVLTAKSHQDRLMSRAAKAFRAYNLLIKCIISLSLPLPYFKMYHFSLISTIIIVIIRDAHWENCGNRGRMWFCPLDLYMACLPTLFSIREYNCGCSGDRKFSCVMKIIELKPLVKQYMSLGFFTRLPLS